MLTESVTEFSIFPDHSPHNWGQSQYNWKAINDHSSMMLENIESNQGQYETPENLFPNQGGFEIPKFNLQIFHSRNDDTSSTITISAKHTKVMTPEDLQRQFLDEQEKFDYMNVEQVALYLREERKKKKFSETSELETQQILGIDQLLSGLNLNDLENGHAFSKICMI